MKSIVSKPWGSYQVIDEGKKYSLKRIESFVNILLITLIKFNK